MTIKIKKINEAAIIPSYSKPGDAGMDLTAISKEVVDKGEYGYISYDFGLALQIPEGYVGLMFPRSSCSNTGAIMANCVGVIDSGFRSSISARFKQIKGTKEYEVGDRVAQLIIVPYPQVTFEEVSELDETVRGAGGYGSTGS